MSASATQLWNLKITKVRKASNYDSDALGGASVSSNQYPHVFWLTAAPQCFQIAMVAH